MSGTSLDGVDAALVDLNGSPHLLDSAFVPYPAELKNALLALHVAGSNELHRAAQLSISLAELYARSVKAVLASSGLGAARVRAIGCHGQTVRHQPAHGYTIQLGNSALLAELTGVAVVSDFRSRDIAAGGQGAPLVPAFHAACFAHPSRHRVILNLGGIANVTNLDPGMAPSGFDTGPGNMLLDAWVHEKLGTAYDQNGHWAAHGTVLEPMLAAMLADPYFASPPPKSTGRDHFHADWLRAFRPEAMKPEDVQATLSELTARSVADAVERHCPGTEEILVCGGGAHNRDLLARLCRALPGKPIESTVGVGVDPDWVEAIAFAWLAQRTLKGEPGNVPAVTGARGSRVLGTIYPA